MSVSKNRREAERWLLTAEEDLRAAETLLNAGLFAQVCFYVRQSGEKAVKALWYWGTPIRGRIRSSVW